MACNVISEKYNGLPSLYANAGEWVEGVLDFKLSYYFGSGDSNKITMSGTAISRGSGNWGTDGFTVGDVITIGFSKYVGPPPLTLSYVRTVTYVNGSVMYLDTALPAPYTNAVFPTASLYTGMSVQINKPAEAVDFYFNLVKNGTQSINSVIDGEVNRFQANNLTSLGLFAPVSMIQAGNKSGGTFEDVTIQLLSIVGIERTYRIEYKFLQWGLLQDGFDIPSYYSASDCLVPSIKVETFSIFNNPNGKQTALNGVLLANTGFFNENFNGGVNDYSLTSIVWKDALLNTINSMDYSGVSSFTATVVAPLQTGASKYKIGFFWDAEDTSEYSNLLPDIDDNLMCLINNVDYPPNVLIGAVYTSGTTLSGANFSVTSLKFEISGGNVIVTGQITPNAQFTTLMDSIPDGGRKFKIFAQFSNSLLLNQDSNRVNLLLFDADCYDAPTLGVQIPTIVSELLTDHGGQDITSSVVANTTTEDDILYKCDFTLTENEVYEGIRCGISARNSVTGESFNLENQFISFNNVAFISGKHIPNITIQRGFLLPPTTDRNVISLQRNLTLDGGGQYGLTLNYGFLLDWRYWIELPAVNDYFFDVNEDFNGKNRNWQRFFSGDWSLYLDLYVNKNGVEDFNHFEFKPRGYEDEPSVSLAVLITAPDGSNPTTFINDAVSNIDFDFSWNQLFDEEWVQVTAETKEGSRIGFISSVLPQGNVSSNVLKPVSGQTMLQLVGNGTNNLQSSCDIDTNGISASEISLTYRVFSVPKGTMGYIIQNTKDAKIAHSVLKVSPDSVYSGPCMKVRRTSDGALLDIGFVNGVLDTASILTFVGIGTAAVHTWYDQSGGNFDSKQIVNNRQPFIVNAGIVMTDPFNGLPAVRFDGIQDHFELNSVFSIQPSMLTTCVLNKEATGSIIGFGNFSSNALTMLWNGASDKIFTYLGGALIDHGTESTFDNALISTSHNFASGDTIVNVNGVLFNTFNEVVNANLYQYIGRNGINYTQGLIQEIIYWDKDKDAQRAIIEANTILRYGL